MLIDRHTIFQAHLGSGGSVTQVVVPNSKVDTKTTLTSFKQESTTPVKPTVTVSKPAPVKLTRKQV